MSQTVKNAANPRRSKSTARPNAETSLILKAIERERERIGQDLHDDLCQILTGVSCLIQVSASRIAPQLPQEAARLQEINTRVIEAMNSARSICHGLHPVHAIGETITDTLNELARLSTDRFGINIKLTHASGTAPLPRHTSDHLLNIFRIAQEAICNAIRHGQATEIEIKLDIKPSAPIRLQIEDNGRGLPKRKTTPDGIGLRTMRHRAAQLGGDITLAPSPHNSHGTLLTLTYPAPALA